MPLELSTLLPVLGGPCGPPVVEGHMVITRGDRQFILSHLVCSLRGGRSIGEPGRPFDFRLATANVLTLEARGEAGLQGSGLLETGKIALLDELFAEEGILAVGLQEARTNCPILEVHGALLGRGRRRR